MNKQQIEKLSKKVRRLYYNPLKKNMDAVEKKMLKDFWDYHIVPVVKEARALARKYKADENIAWLGALLHDVSLAENRYDHDEKSAKIAYKMLVRDGFDKKTAQVVKNIALRHRCRKHKPKTLEEKVVVTADAMNHFLPSFYLGIAVIASEEYAATMRKNMEKLERDYRHKIFFQAEKRLVRKRLADFRRWFGI